MIGCPFHSSHFHVFCFTVSHISLCSRHGPENRNSCYIMLQAYTFCEECCEECVLEREASSNSLFHGFTFLYAQGTDLRTGTVTISCFRRTHSARNVARNVARLPLFEPPGSQSLSLQDLSYTRHGRENRNSYYIMLQAYTFCEECCAECCVAPTL